MKRTIDHHQGVTDGTKDVLVHPYALEWQALHTRDLRDVALAIGRDMDLVRTPAEEVVSDWIGAVQWMAAYAERIAQNADKDAAALRKGGAA
ncbi:hypothetical protein AA13595_0879 [Gluconacetobacter johannae DSM 13595]|uniref:Uncharacterized protein n=1 Tax=Gluconacetobacter johannae TaxID=112140 RepID=A0A7W4J986_9PROT|nr:hypothetical protein [Gluconacetobacter johannae]MBB2177031.1 hypothetical protein [Gluconacetobacter johannae]GBQ82280.1 hypothetical protein AA13595_0879 [Gluconacetobacter johannae DSM 13595]